ncbi:chemotaxis protein CheW [Dactylosporangium sp. NBC_01737]|uniref:chemotaxis protein CheW n=1 Tax=Dactylosporangium sp. NBC_01737 TaxID=2975959 RepID=UPI002E12597F|nr:chemotaxis protein CheW [Dactylosporangium sp. NBC_01737]
MAITAVTEAPPGLSLVFGVGDLLCAIALRDVVETIRPLPVQPLAGTADILLGVSVIRGLAVPVVDTARLLGVGAERPSRFVTTRTGRGTLAYATGPVVGVLPVEPDDSRPPPPMLAAAATRLVAAVGVLDSRPLLFLRDAGPITEIDAGPITEIDAGLMADIEVPPDGA